MINNTIKRQEKLQKLLKITEISEEEFEKLNYKEKQKYFNAKNKLGKVVFVSRDKNGKGITYVKPKEEKNDW